MNKKENQCSELSEKTMDILDNDVLVNLFVSTQKNNLDLCIKKSIEWVFYLLLKYSLWTSTENFGNLVGDYYIWKGGSNQMKYRKNVSKRNSGWGNYMVF